jgi:hypothetical protein
MRYREAFQTEAEALAFIKGVEYLGSYLNSEEGTIEGPEPQLTDGCHVEYIVRLTIC